MNKTAAFVAQLQKAFQFDEQDVVANRDGEMTDKQRSKLLKRLLTNTGIFLIQAILLVSFVVSTSRQDVTFYLIILIALLLCVTYIVIIVHLLTDILQRKVDMLRGRVSLEKQGQKRSTSYTLHIQDEIFKLKRSEYTALRDGRYTLYYAPNSRTILSIDKR